MRRLSLWIAATFAIVASIARAQPQYVGAKVCARCHDAPAQGAVFAQWQASAHARAFETLVASTENEPRSCEDLKLWIVEIGRGVKYGLPRPAAASKECMPCHTTAFGAGAERLAATFDAKAGVQCEACHGPGSAHVEAASAAGGGEPPPRLGRFENERAIEARCKTCHDGTCGDFDFPAMWAKVKHAPPGKR